MKNEKVQEHNGAVRIIEISDSQSTKKISHYWKGLFF